jgi:serine/threonine protein kinase
MAQGDSQEAAGVREGEMIAGKYRVEKVLGVGGMGVVVAPHHVQLDEKVAIKVLLPAMLSNQEVGRPVCSGSACGGENQERARGPCPRRRHDG